MPNGTRRKVNKTAKIQSATTRGHKQTTRRTTTSAGSQTEATKNKTIKSPWHSIPPAPQLGLAFRHEGISTVDIRAKAYRIVSEVIPMILDRLKEAIRRSLVEGTVNSGWISDRGERLGSSNNGLAPFSAPLNDMRRRQELNDLVKDAIAEALARHQPQKLDELIDDSADKEKDNEQAKKRDDSLIMCSRKLQQLILDADVFNQEEQQANDDDIHTICSGKQQLFSREAILEQQKQQQQMDTGEQDANYDKVVAGSALLAAAIQSATEQNAQTSGGDELMNRVSAEMNTLLDCAHDLRQWIELAKAPRDSANNHGLAVQRTAIAIIHGIEKVSRVALLGRSDYYDSRASFMKIEPKLELNDDHRKAFDAHEKLKAVTWRHFAMSLADACARLLDYVSKNFTFIEEPGPKKELTTAITC